MTEHTTEGRDGTGHEEVSRRRVLGLGGAAVLGASLATDLTVGVAVDAARVQTVRGTPSAAEQAPQALIDALRPEIRPRSAWGAELPATGDLLAEEDVRFLLVHHTASTNGYEPEDVVGQIESFYRLHTGPTKNWPDVAYNFFIDRFGAIWEARSGSVEGAVQADATGGSQGHAVLCSLIGNHAEVPVSEEAAASLVSLLAWLGERHNVDTTPGSLVDFVSRGSNLWPAGTEVRTTTIAGHRDMSQTTCPGDFAYALIQNELPDRVTAARLAARAAITTETTVTTAPTPSIVETTPSVPPSTEAPTTTGVREQALTDQTPSEDRVSPLAVLGGTAATAVVVAIAGAARLRRRPPDRL